MTGGFKRYFLTHTEIVATHREIMFFGPAMVAPQIFRQITGTDLGIEKVRFLPAKI